MGTIGRLGTADYFATRVMLGCITRASHAHKLRTADRFVKQIVQSRAPPLPKGMPYQDTIGFPSMTLFENNLQFPACQ